jgi:hypothetical protein
MPMSFFYIRLIYEEAIDLSLKEQILEGNIEITNYN